MSNSPVKPKGLIKGIDYYDPVYQQIRDRFGIESCFLGFKRTNGQYTHKSAVVCCVQRKKELGKFDPRRVRNSVTVIMEGVEHSIPTDVLEIRKKFEPQIEFNPGDQVRSGNGFKATIGAYALHASHGNVFVTAGHFASQAGGKGSTVIIDDVHNNLSQLAGKIVKHKHKGAIDYAIVKPVALSGIDKTNLPITGIYQPLLKEDIGRKLYLVTRRRYVPTVCRHIRARLGAPYVNKPLDNVILTDIASNAGDSGCALVDKHFRLWGFLLGVLPNNFSVFMPVTSLLSKESIEFGVN